MSVRVVVAGAGGRLGTVACAALREAPDIELVGELRRGDDAPALLERTRPDVLLDVTLAEASRVLAPFAVERGVHPVVGTSGLTPEDVQRLATLCAEAGVGGLVVPNFSVGAVLQMRFAELAAPWLPCLGIEEVHHPGKKDSPSGTAKATAQRIGGSVPIRSERRANALAEQTVSFGASGERLTLVHAVSDRRAYVPGILLAVRRAPGLRTLVVGLDALLFA